MVVAAVDDGDPDPGAPERAGRIQTAESPADDDDMGKGHQGMVTVGSELRAGSGLKAQGSGKIFDQIIEGFA